MRRDMAAVLPTLASQASRALGASDGVIHRGAPSPPERRGSVLTLDFKGRWMGELRLIEVPGGAGVACRRIGSPAAWPA